LKLKQKYCESKWDTHINQKLYDLDTYRFNLPPELIAQFPVEPRDSSRLLVMERTSGKIKDQVFNRIVDYFNEGDTLVLNKTRVIPARLFAYKDTGARIEVFLLKKNGNEWESLVRPAKKVKTGTILRLEAAPEIEIEVLGELEVAGGRLICFKNCVNDEEVVENVGHMPLPPYINRQDNEDDKVRYQTVFASENGSVAAPTAGLHFTDRLLSELKARNINIANILLHVGLGTFRPVESSDIRQHMMHYEYYHIDEYTAELLNETRRKQKRIIAVGSTVVRTLETVYSEEKGFIAHRGDTNLFIYPGYQYKAIDGLVTNFHLPGSSLIMLVAAFAGLENTMTAYRYAVSQKYRFFSYGDAMLII